MCNRDQECAVCVSQGSASISRYCSGNGPLSVCLGKGICKCPSGLQSGIDTKPVSDGVTFNLLTEQSDYDELNGLLGPNSEQALTDEKFYLAANPDHFSEQLETDQPVAQMLFDWKSLVGKIPEPSNLDLTDALASDSNPLVEMATEQSNNGQSNAPMFDWFEQPRDIKQEKRMVDP